MRDRSGPAVGFWIQISLLDGLCPTEENALTVGAVYDRPFCVQGAANIGAAFAEAVVASTNIDVDSDSCTNNPGPYIYIDAGNLLLSGAKARVIFTNNAKFTHAASGDAFVDLVLVPEGGNPITWPKQPVLGGVGGNPHVWFIKFVIAGFPISFSSTIPVAR